jgi:hypothetical protein
MKTTLTTLLIFVSIVCNAQTVKYLDKNNVKARIMTSNDKFWNYGGNSLASYEVPVGTGRQAAFANSIWIGGLDAGNQLHIAANTYKQNGFDFWPGPLDTTNIATYSAAASNPYNRLWKVDCDDINNFVTAFNAGSVTANTYTVPNDILNYPAIGTGNFQRHLNPFYDANNNGLYDPATGGDYPLIKGHQQILSIFNDQRLTHTETGGLPMGLEIQERSFAYYDPNLPDSMKAVNFSTFYHYTIINRSTQNYHDVYITDWNDVDLGYYLNDYIGADTVNNFAYCYNGTATDPSGFGTLGYGTRPPVASCALLETNCSNDGIDNDNDSQIDEPGETFQMDRVTFYMNNLSSVNPVMSNPNSAAQYYQYMKGQWKDTSPFTFGGNAYGGANPTNCVFSGNPGTQTGWTEANAGNAPGDRRFLLSSGPFNLPAHGKIEWGYILVFSQDTTANVNTISQFSSRVQRDVRNVRYYHFQNQAPQCTPLVNSSTGISENTKSQLAAMCYPNPAETAVTVDLNAQQSNCTIRLLDVMGRVVKQETLHNAYRAQLEVSDLPSGMYVLQVQNSQESLIYKIVKN